MIYQSHYIDRLNILFSNNLNLLLKSSRKGNLYDCREYANNLIISMLGSELNFKLPMSTPITTPISTKITTPFTPYKTPTSSPYPVITPLTDDVDDFTILDGLSPTSIITPYPSSTSNPIISTPNLDLILGVNDKLPSSSSSLSSTYNLSINYYKPKKIQKYWHTTLMTPSPLQSPSSSSSSSPSSSSSAYNLSINYYKPKKIQRYWHTTLMTPSPSQSPLSSSSSSSSSSSAYYLSINYYKPKKIQKYWHTTLMTPSPSPQKQQQK
ncbi:hypothetical protein ACTFIZ_000595 [Dictyostelium cf. discoideum]